MRIGTTTSSPSADIMNAKSVPAGTLFLSFVVKCRAFLKGYPIAKKGEL